MWQVALMEMSQRFHLDHLQKVVECALQGCRDIYQILDRAVRRHIEVSGSAVRWGSKPQLESWFMDPNFMYCAKSYIFQLMNVILPLDSYKASDWKWSLIDLTWPEKAEDHVFVFTYVNMQEDLKVMHCIISDFSSQKTRAFVFATCVYMWQHWNMENICWVHDVEASTSCTSCLSIQFANTSFSLLLITWCLDHMPTIN
jgi:hypothetical protein